METGGMTFQWLSPDYIREKAEEFRREHIFNSSIPVEIEHVIQSTMGIDIIPEKNLQIESSIDGYISRDFKYIYIDEDLYMDPSRYRRARFTIAHEIGHLILNRSCIELLRFNSVEEWKSFRLSLDPSIIGGIEWQAYEFAGRLLVPVDALIAAYRSTRSDIFKQFTSWDAPKISEDQIFLMASPKIAPKFDVSEDVIERRLIKESITKYL